MLIKVDSKGRLTLPKTLSRGHDLFEAEIRDNTIVFTPVETVPTITLEEAFGKTGAKMAEEAILENMAARANGTYTCTTYDNPVELTPEQRAAVLRGEDIDL